MCKEEITIQVPKEIMDFLRAHEKEIGSTAEEYIAYSIAQAVRADIDAGDVFVPEPEQTINEWHLSSIFDQD